MKEHKRIHKIMGLVLIIFGVLLYPTPIPGTTLLIIVGFVWFIGKRRTLAFLKKHLNKKTFKFLKINKVIKKI